MGLFNFFKKKPPFVDPFFGELKYYSSKNGCVFEGKIFFAPGGSEVVLSIEADTTGPVQAHYDFYKTIERDYSALVDKFIPLIEDEFRNWKDDFVIKDFGREFTVDHLEVPRQDITPVKWSLTYTSIHDRNHWFIFEFEGMELMGLMIDG